MKHFKLPLRFEGTIQVNLTCLLLMLFYQNKRFLNHSTRYPAPNQWDDADLC